MISFKNCFFQCYLFYVLLSLGQKCLCLESTRWQVEANACYLAYQSCRNLCLLVSKRYGKTKNVRNLKQELHCARY